MLCLRRLEGGCNYDYIEVFDGPYHSSPLLARVCDGARGSFTSSSNFMSIRFISDGSVKMRGFQAEYYSSLSPGSTSKSPSVWVGPLGVTSAAQPSHGCEMRSDGRLFRSPRLDPVQKGAKGSGSWDSASQTWPMGGALAFLWSAEMK